MDFLHLVRVVECAALEGIPSDSERKGLHWASADFTRPVALCAAGEPDLEWACEQHGIEVALYPIETQAGGPEGSESAGEPTPRSDIRKDPDEPRRRAFLAGWTAAVNGQLYRTIREKKTHANMGNLFGWIYGDQDLDFRLETWDRYVERMGDGEKSGSG